MRKRKKLKRVILNPIIIALFILAICGLVLLLDNNNIVAIWIGAFILLIPVALGLSGLGMIALFEAMEDLGKSLCDLFGPDEPPGPGHTWQ